MPPKSWTPRNAGWGVSRRGTPGQRSQCRMGRLAIDSEAGSSWPTGHLPAEDLVPRSPRGRLGTSRCRVDASAGGRGDARDSTPRNPHARMRRLPWLPTHERCGIVGYRSREQMPRTADKQAKGKTRDAMPNRAQPSGTYLRREGWSQAKVNKKEAALHSGIYVGQRHRNP